jgi:GNAT superfamily N-acetyltransferase
MNQTFAAAALTLREWEPSLAPHFHDINFEWIEAMFELEAADREVLQNPQGTIIDPGGTILFVEAPGLGIIGACALKPDGSGAFELTKMGVREAARGLKAGEFLLEKVIERAGEMSVDQLYLLTNKKCAAAIHLYEKRGFVHDADVMARHGGDYGRCDVAMRYAGLPRG